METRRMLVAWGAAVLWMVVSPQATAGILLQNATATYTSEPYSFWSPAKTIDGATEGVYTSWTVYRPDETPGNWVHSETIVWETQQDVTVSCETPLLFLLYQADWIPLPGHTLGRFRLSYTTDDRSTFADGLLVGGDVSANWVVINPSWAYSQTGEQFTKLADLSLLVSGGANEYPTYMVGASLSAAGITGFRLEALKDPSLPYGGPGRQIVNGNFQLSEFVVVPEPVSLVFLIAGAAGVIGRSKIKEQR
jgi:hypothetical protein